MIQFPAKTARLAFAALLWLCNTAWAKESGALPPLKALVEQVDGAYRKLPASIADYNFAVRELCTELEMERPRQFASNLRRLGVEFDSPKVPLPLRRVQVAASSPGSDSKQIGCPAYSYPDLRLPCRRCRFFLSTTPDIDRSITFFALVGMLSFRLFFFTRAHAFIQARGANNATEIPAYPQ